MPRSWPPSARRQPPSRGRAGWHRRARSGPCGRNRLHRLRPRRPRTYRPPARPARHVRSGMIPASTNFGRERVQLFPSCGVSRADPVESGFGGPDHIGAMNVRGNADIVAVDLGEVLHGLRQGRVPALGFKARASTLPRMSFVRPVDDVLAKHQHGSRRVAGGNPGLQCGLRLITATACNRDGRIGPGNAIRRRPYRGQHPRAAASPPEVQKCMTSTEGSARAEPDGRKQKCGYGQKPHSRIPSCRSPGSASQRGGLG